MKEIKPKAMTALAELKKKHLQDAEVRRGYDEAAAEFSVFEALSKARPAAEMPQAQAAEERSILAE